MFHFVQGFILGATTILTVWRWRQDYLIRKMERERMVLNRGGGEHHR